jgi:hypothetical protein
MRFKLIIVAVVATALSVSVAAAAPAKGKPDKPAPASCKMRNVELRGLLVSKTDTSFTMTVKQANGHAKAFKQAGATVNVDASTKMRRDGKTATLADLAAGDRVLVLARVCRADLKGGATPALLARQVLARSPKAPSPADES